MIPPTWMIEELERRRREQQNRDRPALRIEVELPVLPERRPEPSRRSGEPIVIEL